MPTNPFEAHSAKTAAVASSQALFSSKALADEIRRDDAAMEADLAVLAPRNRTADVTGSALGGSSSRGGTAKSASATGAASLHAKENITTEAYISKTREVGLVRMSLQAKKAEIRKLEADIDRAEKRLRQRQEQLESTREKFNSFLKYSNLEQDAAVRRAENESKAKQERVVEIKKQSARINHVELDIRKAQLQLESCRAYKRFLDNLAKPRWFYDVLTELRVADRTEEILLETEDAFETRSREVEAAYVEATAAREAANERRVRGTGTPETESLQPEVVPLEVQLADLESAMAAEAQSRAEEAAAAIRVEIDALPVDEVRNILERDYDETRVPLYFKDVDELLEVFINVEEGNLFLIQNCQELEEELEAIAMAHLTERTDTQTMTAQRHSQMSVLKDKIAAAQAKLKQLEDRAEGLERHAPAASAAAGAGGTSTRGGDGSGEAGGGNSGAAAAMAPEVYRTLMEDSITSAFRTLTAGETSIKHLSGQLQRLRQRASEAEGGEQASATDDEHRRTASVSSRSAAAPGALGATVDGGKDARSSVSGGGGGSGTRGAKKVRRAGGAEGAGGAPTGAAAASTAAGGADAGANMGAVELLTLIENKLQEYYRYLTDPANEVDEALIVAVMKASDKERRRQARREHMARQAEEHEERARKALERSQAPVVRRAGKPVLRRSCLKRTEAAGHGGTAEGKSQRAAGARGSRAVDDGAEFFT